MRNRTGVLIILGAISAFVCLGTLVCLLVLGMTSGVSRGGTPGGEHVAAKTDVPPTSAPVSVAPTLTPMGATSAESNPHYWTHGCTSADETVLGAVGDEAALVDLASGEIRQQIVAYFDDVACLPNGEVVALARDGLFSVKEAAWLEQWEKVVPWDVVGPLADRRIVTHFRQIDTTYEGSNVRYQGPLILSVRDLGESDGGKYVVELSPDRFPGLGAKFVRTFQTFPVRVLDDGRVAVVAGREPNFSFGKVQPLPWGFFTVDLVQDTVTPLGPIRIGDDAINLYLPGRMDVTPDGRIMALAVQQWKGGVAVVELRSDTPQETFRVTIENAQEVNHVRLDRRGDLLAVVTDGDALYVFDGPTGHVLWAGKHAGGSINYLQFLSDDSLVVMTSQRGISRRNGRDGQALWESRASQ